MKKELYILGKKVVLAFKESLCLKSYSKNFFEAKVYKTFVKFSSATFKYEIILIVLPIDLTYFCCSFKIIIKCPGGQTCLTLSANY